MGFKKSDFNHIFAKVSEIQEGKEKFFGIHEMHKVDGKWVIKETHQGFEGVLILVELGKYEFEGEEIHTLKMVLEDTPEQQLSEDSEVKKRYIITFNFNYATRAMINAMLSCSRLNGAIVELSARRKDGNNRIYLKIDGERYDWKFDFDELPAVKQFGRNQDDSEVNAFFINELYTHVLPQFASASNSQSFNEDDSENDDDLPF